MTQRTAGRFTVVVTMAALLALCATALAGAPKPGTYQGALAAPRTTYLVSMKLSGVKLTHITLSNVPIYCSGGGPAIPVAFPGSKLSAAGRFTANATVRIKVGPKKGQIGEKLTLSGRFAHGKVTGTLKTVFVGFTGCSGSSRFSAKR
jgi:hypothetical protein